MQARPANQANQANLYRIAVLIDDLKHEIVETRITSIRSLKEIAVALGEERTREELLPFLDDTSVDDEDEVLMVLAEELGGLTDYIGGVAYISSLLKPLEQLTTVEEPSVREKAIASICFLVEKMSNKDVGEYFVPMIRRLAEKDWYTSRVASCALFAAAYPKATPEIKAEIRGMFGRLSKDDTILVRKAASQHISKLAKVVEAELMRSELLPIFQKLAKDDQDSVRILAVPNIVEFSQLSITDTQRHEILANVFDLVKDKAWRVRWTVAQGFVDILKQIDKTEGNEELPRYVKLFVRLLRDEEAEVKAAATLKMASVARELKSMPAMVAEEFMPAIKELFEDTCDFVRAALASVIFGMAPVLGKDRTVENLVPFIIGLLKDAESEVRLNLISKLDDIEGVFSVEDIGEALLPSVSELAKDGQWRIRHSIILHVPLVAKHLSIRTFDASLVDLCMIWLHDEVFSIREVATNNLKALAEIYGEAWTKQHVIPKVIEMNASSSYLFRMQALRAVESLSTVISQEIMNTRLIPLVVKMAEDPTANIRFNVAKCFRKIYETLDTAIVEQEVKPCLRTLAQDADRDVKYFAEKTLKRIEGGIADKEVTIKMDIK